MTDNEWVSVKDRLPAKANNHEIHRVLVYNDNFGVRIDYRRYDGEWQRMMGLYGEYTHWMPSPKPPEVSDE